MLRTERQIQPNSLNLLLGDPLDPVSSQCDPLGLNPPPADNRQRFLRFMLAQKNDALIPLTQILEIIPIALEDIFPVPDMPGCILGVCSWQGETLWLVDLNDLVGYEPLCEQAQPVTPFVIVVQSDECALGLVVEQVDDVDLFDEDKIRIEKGLCLPSLDPFVRGYCPNQGGMVLNVAAMVESPLWQAHRSEQRGADSAGTPSKD
ncbi:MAG: chemotaxis protein CheW [Phormidesmis sp.]